MNIELNELKEILCGERKSEEAQGSTPLGQKIVVLDRGFVYVGDVYEQPDRLVILNAKNIRVWGTSQGLGELRNGPLSGTKLDVVGEVAVYRHAVIHIITCKGF
jgi:hypothetical protein